MSAREDLAKTIFLSAVELPSDDQRRAYVSVECGSDPELVRQVLQLLQHHERVGSFLETPPPGIDAPSIVEQPGTRIGPYTLLDQIGEGGMGVVYRAEQQEPVCRKVALKIVKPGMDTRDVIARFQVERQALAMMNHSNIARVFGAGATESGRPYFVMELVQGVPITEFADEHRLTIGERLELFCSVCEAIQHAHQKGIIHRDIKPSNVIVALEGDEPVPKIIDFGIAKAISRDSTTAAVTTGVGQIVGSPLYMSPEQAGEGSSDVDTRTDIYSLGILLYELLTGTTPFAEERLRESSYEDVRRLIREAEPLRPSSRISTPGMAATTVSAHRKTNPVKLRRLLRGDLDWIVIKALEKDRNRRYATVQQLAEDVRCFIESKPVRARRPTLMTRSARWAGRHRTIVVSVAVVLAVAASVIGTRFLDNTRRIAAAERAAAEHIAAARAFLQSEDYADATRELSEARGHLDDRLVAAGSLADAIALLSAQVSARVRAVERFNQFQRLRLRVQAYMYTDEAGSLQRVQRNGTVALDLYEVSELADRKQFSGFVNLSASRQAVVSEAIAELLFVQACTELAIVQRGRPTASAHKRALESLERIESTCEPVPAVFEWIAESRRALDQQQLAEDADKRARALSSELALNDFIHGELEYLRGRDEKAIESYSAALRQDPDHLLSQLAMGLTLLKVGQHQRAETVLQRVVSMNPDIVPDRIGMEFMFPEGPEYGRGNRVRITPDLAMLHFQRGMARLGDDSDAAVSAFDLALQFDPSFALAYFNRGLAIFGGGDADQAMNDWKDAVQFGLSSSEVYNNRAVLFFGQGEPEVAVANLKHGIRIEPKRAELHYNMGVIHACQGELNQAVENFDKSIQADPDVALAYAHRALTRAKLGQLDEALNDVRRIAELQPPSERALSMVPVKWLSDDESNQEPMRRFHSEAARLLNVTEKIDEETGTHDTEEEAAGEHPVAMESLTGLASAERTVCTPGVMTLAIISQAVDLNQQEYRAMSLARLRNRPTNRRRRLFLEPLEDRRMLAVEISIDDVTANEGDDTGVFVDQLLPAPGLAGELLNPTSFVIGPNGNFYVASGATDEILQYDQSTGDLIDVFVPAEFGGLDSPRRGITFGPDGSELYVAGGWLGDILRYDGITGAYIDTPISGGRVDVPTDVLFAEDGTLYVASWESDEVLRYNVSTGELLEVVMSASDGLDGPRRMLLHEGDLFVLSMHNDQVLRYDGEMVEAFVSPGSGGLDNPQGLGFGPDGNFYVSGVWSDAVHRYDGTTGAYIDDLIGFDSGDLGFPTHLLFTSGELYLASATANLIARYDATTGEYTDAFITSGRPRAPWGMELGADGNLYVSSWQGSSVLSFEGQSGTFLEYVVEPHSAGIRTARGVHFGPDGNLYVGGGDDASIYRLDGTTGDFDIFIPQGTAGLIDVNEFLFHGNVLYVSNHHVNNILRFDAYSGQFIDEFVAAGSGGLDTPRGLRFGPDGNLYVASCATGQVLRFDGTTGAFMDAFADEGNLIEPNDLAFSPNGDLYVGSSLDDRVIRYDGATGAYVDDFVPSGLGGLSFPEVLLFDSNGTLYVSNQGPTNSGYVMRYATASHAVFTVSLSSPSDIPVTVDYVASSGTADIGSDFKAVSGTLTFDPGVTSRSIVVPTIDDLDSENNETFFVTLSSPTGGATILDETGQATIVDVEGPLFSDGFESGAWNGLWVEDSQDDWFTSTQRAKDGIYSAEVDGRATDAKLTVDSTFNLTRYGSAELSFDWFIESGLDSGEYLALDLFNGSDWITDVATLEGNVGPENTWVTETISVDGAYLVGNFQFRFRAKMNKSDEAANVDNVQLVATSMAGPPNTAPVAQDDSDVTDEDVPVTIDALLNDSDLDGDDLQVASVGQGANGTVVNNGGDVTYTPDQDFNGTDTFTYAVADGRGGTDTATVTVIVNSVPDDPVALNDSATTDEETPIDLQVLDNDSDGDNDTLTIISVTQPASGTVANYGTYVTFTPAATGTYTFDYTISDGNGGSSTATVTMHVTAVSTDIAIYVYDIRFESKRGNKDWRAVFEIRSDSNDNGEGDAGDNVVEGVAIEVEFAGQTYTGTTDSDGVFRTGWIKNLSRGDHLAEVVDLVLTNYFWDPFGLDLDLEEDSDGDGLPDKLLEL